MAVVERAEMPDQAPIPGDAQESVASDSETSFALLVQQYQSKLVQFVLRYARNRQDAEDLAQETFVKAFRNFHRYDSKYAFSTWLYTIARRTAYNYYRSARPTEPLEFEIVDTAQTPSVSAEKADRRDSIWESAKSLKPDFREALTLKYVEDLSVGEIAKIMNKSQANVKIMLFRARNQLKKIHPMKP